MSKLNCSLGNIGFFFIKTIEFLMQKNIGKSDLFIGASILPIKTYVFMKVAFFL